jgi:Zn-dependent protease
VESRLLRQPIRQSGRTALLAKRDSHAGRNAAGLGALGALLVKFKFALVFLLTKAKLLLLGLTKASTFFSMLLSAGVYWTIWGWKFALGVVLSIYLLPVWQLDGGRGFRALTRGQRWIAAAVIASMWLLTGEGLLVLLGLAAAASAVFAEAADQPDPTILVQYGVLVIVLSLLTWSAVPTVTR